MKHIMNLHHTPFLQIQMGVKKIETRLFDEKRKKIKKGDTILFISRETNERVLVTVKEMHLFKTFNDLFNAFKPELFGSETKEELLSIYEYYSVEEEYKYGVVGIEFSAQN